MKLLGLQIPNFTFPGVTNDRLFDHVAMLATTAERAGFDSVFVMDHFYQLSSIGPPTEPMLEGYTVLAGLAVRTKKVRLGTLVTGVTYRNPAFQAAPIPRIARPAETISRVVTAFASSHIPAVPVTRTITSVRNRQMTPAALCRTWTNARSRM